MLPGPYNICFPLKLQIYTNSEFVYSIKEGNIDYEL